MEYEGNCNILDGKFKGNVLILETGNVISTK